MAGRELTADLVVVVPGITGSALEVGGRDVWALSGRAVMRGVVSLGRSVERLRLPEGFGDVLPGRPGEGEPGEFESGGGVRATGLMPDLHVVPGLWSPVKGYSGVVGRLREQFGGEGAAGAGPVIEFPYDWRLSNVVSARRLEEVVVPALERWQKQTANPDARLVLVCHSMGGLVARWFLEVLGGHELTRWLVTIGTPYQGSVKSLGALVNGLPMGLGPLKRDLGDLVRSFPSSYELLPTYPCLDCGSEGMEPVEGMRRLGEVEVPGLNTRMVAAAAEFHARIAAAVAKRPERGYRIAAIKGIFQPTMQSARLTPGAGAAVELLPAFAGKDTRGDGTVARPSSHPPEWGADEAAGQVVFAAQKHATLQETDEVFQQLFGLLTSGRLGSFMGGLKLGMDVPDLLRAGEPLLVEVNAEDQDSTLVLNATITAHDGNTPVVEPELLTNVGEGRYEARLTGLPEGTYQMTVDSAVPARPVDAVSDLVVVWDPDRE